MEESIEVNEKYSNNWKPTLYSSLVIAAITFIIFLNLDDVIWTGIFRLIAFISFSLSIFCMLKIMEGKKTFKIAIHDESIQISYIKNKEVIRTEQIKQKEIESIYKAPFYFTFPFTEMRFPLKTGSNFKVRYKDEESDISLFKFGGRVLAVDEKESHKLESFFKDHDLYSQS